MSSSIRRESFAWRRGSASSHYFTLDNSSLTDTVRLDLESLKYSGIYGRDEELALLSEAFERIKHNDAQSEVVFLHGVSGTGKSTLIRYFETKVVAKSKGYYCSGKFDQIQEAAKPYSAIVDAVSQLCEFIMGGENVERLRNEMGQEIGSELEIITKLIPSVGLFAMCEATTQGTSDDGRIKSPTTSTVCNKSSFAFTRFKEVFRIFLRLLSSYEHPLLIFLDDLQWADMESQEVLADLLSDAMSKNILFVVAFRDDGEPVYQPPNVIALVAHDVVLGDLDTASINKMISVHAKMDPSETQELAELVVQRTGGNIYFVIQFVNMLQKDGLLFYSDDMSKFEWTISQIEAQTNVSVNILDVVTSKINLLPDDVKRVLQWGACLGFTFDIRVVEQLALQEGLLNITELETISEPTDASEEVFVEIESAVLSESNATRQQRKHFLKLLVMAKKEKLIDRSDSKYKMKFSHDRVQQCVYESTPPGFERERLHLTIGQLVWDLCKAQNSQVESLLLIAADQLNQGSNQIADEDTKLALAELNFNVGKKAMAKSAFNRAASYFRKAIDLLNPETRWLHHYELCLELHNLVAEMDYAQGKFSECDIVVDEIVRYGRRLEDKLRAYHVRVESLGVRRKLAGAIEESLAIMRLLGEKLPMRPSTITILMELGKTKRLLKGKKGDDFLQLPSMTDAKQIAKMRLLGSFSLFYWHADMEASLAFTFLRMMHITLKHGLCKYSPFAFAAYGMLLSTLGAYEEAYSYGCLAMDLLDNIANAYDCEARTRLIVLTFLDHFKKPLPAIGTPLLEGYRAGRQTGEVEFAAACLSSYGGFNCLFGMSLESLDTDMKNYFKFFEDYHQDFSAVLLRPWHQMVQNLMGKSPKPLELTGSVMVEGAFIKDMAERNNPIALVALWCVRMFLLYILGEVELAGIEMKKLIKRRKGTEGNHFQTYFLRMHMALVCFGLARIKNRRKYLVKARGLMASLEKLSKQGAVNAVILLFLLKAEEKTFQRVSVVEVKKAFDDAISSSARTGFSQVEAIANERAGHFMLAAGDAFWGRSYVLRSWHLYHEWGAVAKVRQMERKYDFLQDSVDDFQSSNVQLRGQFAYYDDLHDSLLTEE